MLSSPQVTILIPNYKTALLTKLCLRLLRKYTDSNLAEVVVIDNDSNDNSTEYLRGLAWIRLIERTAIAGETGAQAHAAALDLGLSTVRTPYVLSIHTDTLVRNAGWLPFLLAQIEHDENIAGVGSWKLEQKSPWSNHLKTIEHWLQKIYYQLRGKNKHALEGVGDNYYYLRSHCALYRTELLRAYGLSFSAGNEVAGKVMHQQLIARGHKMVFLDSQELLKYLDHINHATMVLNAEFNLKDRHKMQGLHRITTTLEKFQASQILQDSKLDK